MKMLIVRYKNAKTGKSVAERMGVPCRTFITKKSRYRFIVNYGHPNPYSRYGLKPHLNAKLIPNKLRAMEIMGEVVNTPPTWRNFEDIPEEEFPVLGRNYNHTRANDIVIIEDKNNRVKKPYYVKFIKAIGEYRVHILGDNVVSIAKKKPNENMEVDDKIRSHGRGWRQIEYRREGRYWSEVGEIGKKAVKALEYDFGCVDMIMDGNHKIWVLEVNSAPALIERRMDLYIEYFKEEERKWKLQI